VRTQTRAAHGALSVVRASVLHGLESQQVLAVSVNHLQPIRVVTRRDNCLQTSHGPSLTLEDVTPRSMDEAGQHLSQMLVAEPQSRLSYSKPAPVYADRLVPDLTQHRASHRTECTSCCRRPEGDRAHWHVELGFTMWRHGYLKQSLRGGLAHRLWLPGLAQKRDACPQQSVCLLQSH
jgi:hypothetical protein